MAKNEPRDRTNSGKAQRDEKREAEREKDFRAAMEESKRLNEESGGHGPHGTDKG